MTDTHPEQLRILGPTVRGTFFIATADNLVWTPRGWRQFGQAKEFSAFRGAWMDTDNARAALVEGEAS